jgi:hypothetical protein
MKQPPPDAFILRSGEGRPIDLGAFRMLVKATADDTGGAFSLLEADEPAGFGPPLHIHHDAAEAFYVLEGEYIIFRTIGKRPARPARSSSFLPGRAMGSRSEAGQVESSISTSRPRWSGISTS